MEARPSLQAHVRFVGTPAALADAISMPPAKVSAIRGDHRQIALRMNGGQTGCGVFPPLPRTLAALVRAWLPHQGLSILKSVVGRDAGLAGLYQLMS